MKLKNNTTPFIFLLPNFSTKNQYLKKTSKPWINNRFLKMQQKRKIETPASRSGSWCSAVALSGSSIVVQKCPYAISGSMEKNKTPFSSNSISSQSHNHIFRWCPLKFSTMRTLSMSSPAASDCLSKEWLSSCLQTIDLRYNLQTLRRRRKS